MPREGCIVRSSLGKIEQHVSISTVDIDVCYVRIRRVHIFYRPEGTFQMHVAAQLAILRTCKIWGSPITSLPDASSCQYVWHKLLDYDRTPELVNMSTLEERHDSGQDGACTFEEVVPDR